jgi:hypothetical protein
MSNNDKGVIGISGIFFSEFCVQFHQPTQWLDLNVMAKVMPLTLADYMGVLHSSP